MNRDAAGAWLLPVSWMAIIYLFSTDLFSAAETGRILSLVAAYLFPHLSPQVLEGFHHVIRKLGHVTEYGILATLLFRAFRLGAHRGFVQAGVKTLLVVFVYAVTDEFHQCFVPSRSPSLRDVGLDILGAILVVVTIAAAALIRPADPHETVR